MIEPEKAGAEPEKTISEKPKKRRVSTRKKGGIAGAGQNKKEPKKQIALKGVWKMGKMDQLCQQIVSDVDGALACGVVDLESGMMMGVHHSIPYFTQDYIDAVAAAAVDMFRGRNISRIEQLIAKQRGSTPEHTMEESFMTTKGTYHFMKVVPGKNSLIVLITKRTTNQGMGWSAVRMSVGDVAAAMGG